MELVRKSIRGFELDRAERRGATTAARVGWTLLTASPGIAAVVYQIATKLAH